MVVGGYSQTEAGSLSVGPGSCTARLLLEKPDGFVPLPSAFNGVAFSLGR